MQHVEDQACTDQYTLIQQNSAVVIDGMAVVNEIIKDKSMKIYEVSRLPHISGIMSFVGRICFITDNLYHNLDTGDEMFTPSTHYFSFFSLRTLLTDLLMVLRNVQVGLNKFVWYLFAMSRFSQTENRTQKNFRQ